jgi:chromosome segregation ATPase
MIRAAVLALCLLAGNVVAIPEQSRPSAPPAAAKADAMRAMSEASAQLAELNRSQSNVIQLNERMSELHFALSKEVEDVTKAATQGRQSPAQLQQSLKQLMQTQVRIAAEYRKLQETMQNENQHFASISNVLKARHDTAQSAVQNMK